MRFDLDLDELKTLEKLRKSGAPIYIFKLLDDGRIWRTEVKEWWLHDCRPDVKFRMKKEDGREYITSRTLEGFDKYVNHMDKNVVSFNKECDAKGIIREAFNNLLSKKRAEKAHLEKQITEITEKLTALDKDVI